MNIGQDKTILITGSSRGIGYHLSKRFLALGFSVVGLSRSDTKLADERFRQIKIDLGNIAEVNRLRDQIAEYSICGLINNAGIHGPIGPFETNDITEWVSAFQVNLFSAAALSRICIPSLKKNRGFIIFLSGGGSAFPKPNFSAYGVSKTAVVRLSEVLASELSPDVLVYCVAPGPNRTQLLENAIRGGEIIAEEEILDFDYVERLCVFLALNRDPRYSGKFIHAKDQYETWGDQQLSEDGYTLRRIKL